MSGTIWAVVVAGGTGSRLGLPYNKVFADLGGCAVLTRTLRALSESRCYDGILLVLNPRDEKAYRELEAREGLKDLVQLTAWGGETRQQSVKNGLDALPDKLRQTAELRLAHPELTLSQLSVLFQPPITKSALNHRLRKLLDLAGEG